MVLLTTLSRLAATLSRRRLFAFDGEFRRPAQGGVAVERRFDYRRPINPASRSAAGASAGTSTTTPKG